MEAGTLAAIVVGQAPRPDVEALLQGAVGPAARVRLVGCMDGLSRAEMEAEPPLDEADTLFTRLPDGTGATLSKKVVMGRAQMLVDRFADEGVRATLMCCTGAFPGLRPAGVVVFPARRAERARQRPAAQRQARPAGPAARAGHAARRRNGRDPGWRWWRRRWCRCSDDAATEAAARSASPAAVPTSS
jgi:hypothetical protein